MKRDAFLRGLRAEGCLLKRHGRRHDIWENPATGKSTAVPRHAEINDILARAIRKQLGLSPTPRG